MATPAPSSRTPPRSARRARRSSFPMSSAAPSCSRRRSWPAWSPIPGCISACGWRAARSHSPARWPTPSLPRCAEGRRRIRLSRRRLRPRRRVPHGWTSFVAGFAGAIAANAVFHPDLSARFIPGVDNQTPFFTIPLPFVPLTISTHTLVAVASVWLLAAIHIRGVGPGR